MLLDMCLRVLNDSRQSDKEAKTAAQLLMVVLHHCKGRVDEYVSPMLAMLSEKSKTVRMRSSLCFGRCSVFSQLRPSGRDFARVFLPLTFCLWTVDTASHV